MTSDHWLNTHTFHYSDFSDLNKLVEIKEKKKLTVSLCFPTLNEEKTIAKEIIIMRSELVLKSPLIDEILVIDSGSTDNTVPVAREYGADVYIADDILPELPEKYKGKGENLWKALYVAKGDIIVYLDADIKNIHHRFAYGLIGPLLLKKDIKFTKAFYDRPISEETGVIRPSGGGRVTELVTRPLFSLLYPGLAQIIQPLSGEYAAYREILDRLNFPIGYGVETGMLLEIYDRWGLDVMAQVDLDKRIHRNQDTLALGRMSFSILHTFFKFAQNRKLIALNQPLHDRLIQYQAADDIYMPKTHQLKHQVRPPMIELETYRKRFPKRKKAFKAASGP
ncbi:MAG TPA: glucosyl-3-phosphoglycerate synthase [bacterium]|nr:glucosyl-3-phosphoglycerate synthase [bacterium]